MNLRFFLFVAFLVLLILGGNPASAFANTGNHEYLPGRIIVKLEDSDVFFKQQQESGRRDDTSGYLQQKRGQSTDQQTSSRDDASDAGPAAIVAGRMSGYGMEEMLPVFRQGTADHLLRAKRAGSHPDRLHELAGELERTYTITYSSGIDPLELSAEIRRLPGVIYAEPHFVHETTDLPVTELPTNSLPMAGLPADVFPANGQSAATDLQANNQPTDDLPGGSQNSAGNDLSGGSVPDAAGTSVLTNDEFIPNDPRFGGTGQNYFAYQNFLKAWAVTTGSADVVIAIVDSGVYYDHPDLISKLWRNPEPGRANDYFPQWEIVNDTIGWNFWESGNVFNNRPPVQNGNPVGNYSTHGTHVAGTAAADTDNGIGIAGAGFNARIMPIKTGGTKEYPRNIAFGYHGMLYAAVNGADVINCSFGGTNSSEFGSDVTAFAIASGSVVVAAAGNNGSDVLFYPAAFDDVLTVGSVRQQQDDVLSNFSNYGFYVDVFAMGEGLMSTVFDYNETEVSWTPGYGLNTGTSMSAPVVSGLAALVKSQHPDWSPQRIATQIRTTARSVSSANTDSRFKHRLGKGLIDAYGALTDLKPGFRVTEYTFTTSDGDKINPGESGVLNLKGVNHGEPAAAHFEISEVFDGISVHPSSVASGQVATGETFSIDFDVYISRNYRLDDIPLFRLDMSAPANDYSDFFMFDYERLLFEILDINSITTSISSDGTIGFMDAFASSGGVGFIPENYGNVLFEGGLMISADIVTGSGHTPEPVIINQVRDSTEITRHFLPDRNIRFMKPGNRSDVDGWAEFRSTEHPSADQLIVEMNTYAFSASELDQTFFVRYKIRNNSLDTLQNMYVGLFNDWDIRNAQTDHVGYFEEDSLIYAYDPGGPPLVAVAHMGAVSSAFAINNPSTMSLPDAQSRQDSLNFGVYYLQQQDRFDGFTDAEKRLALTAGTERTMLNDTDISIVTGTGPFTLNPHATIDVGFIYGWGEDLEDLRAQIASARGLELFEPSAPGEYSGYREMAEEVSLYQNFPNPFNASTTIEFHIPEPGPAELSVYNILGQRVVTILDEYVDDRSRFVTFDGSQLASGVYIVRLRAGGQAQTMKMSLIK